MRVKCCSGNYSNTYLDACQASMMKHFPKIPHGFWPLTTSSKASTHMFGRILTHLCSRKQVHIFNFLVLSDYSFWLINLIYIQWHAKNYDMNSINYISCYFKYAKLNADTAPKFNVWYTLWLMFHSFTARVSSFYYLYLRSTMANHSLIILPGYNAAVTQ